MNIESLKTKLKHGKEFSRLKCEYGKFKEKIQFSPSCFPPLHLNPTCIT